MRFGLLSAPAPRASRRKTASVLRVEGLERRLQLSTAASLPVTVTSARTADSRSVTFGYEVRSPNLPSTLEFGVYRSADAAFDAGDRALASMTVSTSTLGQSTADLAGGPAAAVGRHEAAIEVPGGLGIEPDRPYVLVVAQPSTAEGAADAASRTASIRTRSVAVVTHGGIQAKSSDRLGPIWQRNLTKAVKAQGYDTVVKYVWATQSRHPGKAVEQGPKIGRILNRIAADVPDDQPINVHFIGHSEGAIVNSRAAQLLQFKQAPQIAAGFMKMTMLDPHSANNAAPGYQYSTKNTFAGRIARDAIRLFQWQAQDPIARVPNNVDDAEVFWQHTRVDVAHTDTGLYNLWGQVPVIGQAKYYDITGPGIAHTGEFGVQVWYTANVAPTLHSGGNFIDPTVLTGSREKAAADVSTQWYSTASTNRPTFSGTAAPGAAITLFAARNGSYGWKSVGEGRADATGAWRVGSRSLHDGRYRFAVRSAVPAFRIFPGVKVTPRLRLGSVTIRGRHDRTRI